MECNKKSGQRKFQYAYEVLGPDYDKPRFRADHPAVAITVILLLAVAITALLAMALNA